ncbi:basic proline-rich protein-like [Pyrgilauda ruficollis]|uniref:basic proline-rich protein-like n=1 Tax=Pyrgilauda ruficollis TaxID=221976 RepID=UPI001B85DBCA|nr:basic proline-rich protein-like [Pyrgilauda ruficollis]
MTNPKLSTLLLVFRHERRLRLAAPCLTTATAKPCFRLDRTLRERSPEQPPRTLHLPWMRLPARSKRPRHRSSPIPAAAAGETLRPRLPSSPRQTDTRASCSGLAPAPKPARRGLEQESGRAHGQHTGSPAPDGGSGTEPGCPVLPGPDIQVLPAPSAAAPQRRTAESARLRCSPARNDQRPRPGRSNSAHRTTPRRQPAPPDPPRSPERPLPGSASLLPLTAGPPCPMLADSAPLTVAPGAPPRSPSLPVSHRAFRRARHPSPPRCPGRAHRPSPPVPSVPAALTVPPRPFPVSRPRSPALPARSQCPGRAHRPSPPVPGVPAPLTVPPHPFPVSRPRSPSLSATRPLLPEQKASSAPRTAPPASGPTPAPPLRYWLLRTPINPRARRAPPPPDVFIRSPLAGARSPRPLPAGDWTAGRGGRGAAAAEQGRDHEGTTWVTSVGAARWGRAPPLGRAGGAGTPGPCGDPRAVRGPWAVRGPPSRAGTPEAGARGRLEAAFGKGSGLLALRQPGPRRTGPAGCCRRVPGEAAVTQCPSHPSDMSQPTPGPPAVGKIRRPLSPGLRCQRRSSTGHTPPGWLSPPEM